MTFADIIIDGVITHTQPSYRSGLCLYEYRIKDLNALMGLTPFVIAGLLSKKTILRGETRSLIRNITYIGQFVNKNLIVYIFYLILCKSVFPFRQKRNRRQRLRGRC